MQYAIRLCGAVRHRHELVRMPMEGRRLIQIRAGERAFGSETQGLNAGNTVDDGLVTVEAERITATSRGRLLLRIIAMCFDRYLNQPAQLDQRPRYSRVI